MAPITEESTGVDIPKANDLVVRVRRLKVDGETFVDIREFVPSIEVYGRGILVPLEASVELSKAIAAARKPQ